MLYRLFGLCWPHKWRYAYRIPTINVSKYRCERCRKAHYRIDHHLPRPPLWEVLDSRNRIIK